MTGDGEETRDPPNGGAEGTRSQCEPTGARIGVDIGGTFTDLMLVDDDTGEITVGKTLTTPTEPAAAVESGAADTLERSGIAPDAVRRVIHGTTLVTNALIERKGSTTALITTRGYRDALEIRRENRYDLYDIFLEMPEPLVPRYLRLEVDERVLSDGSVRQPLDREQVARLVRELDRKGIEALAVSLLHSYANPRHEREIADVVADVASEMELSLSSEVVPELKEYERTSTTACNVYVKRLVGRYLADLEERLAGLELDAELLVMLSSGGVGTVETSRRFPIRLLESGPAAGALASAHLGSAAGHRDLFSFDMGGTTAKLCVIDDGEPLTTSEFEVGRVYRFKKGSGLPVKTPVIEMIEIGAGGGSIARVDSMGLLKVGPESAGSDPGPACYGLGGVRPTVTDATVLLGYLDPGFFLGGEMDLDVDAARAAVGEHVAEPLSMDLTEAAWGIYQVVNENMAGAARVHAVERGKDPGDFPLFAFGGAGPVHAFAVGRILRSPAVIVPVGAGVGSTIGFLTAPLSFDLVRTDVARMDRVDGRRLAGLYGEMEAEGLELLRRSGLSRERITVERTAELRYVGQGQEITVPVPGGELDAASVETIRTNFDRVYRRLYGRLAEGVPVEGLNWRVRLTGPKPELDLGRGAAERSDIPSDEALKGERAAYFPDLEGYSPTPVYDRYRLAPGAGFQGPAIVEERESTVVVGADATVEIDASRNLVVRYGPEG